MHELWRCYLCNVVGSYILPVAVSLGIALQADLAARLLVAGGGIVVWALVGWSLARGMRRAVTDAAHAAAVRIIRRTGADAPPADHAVGESGARFR